jgi:hypothetical protein
VKIKNAQAESETKRLQGEGVAAQRKAILRGLQRGVEELSTAIGISSDETMKYTMLTQYFDMLRDVGTTSNKATVFIPHSPGSLNEFQNQITASLLEHDEELAKIK